MRMYGGGGPAGFTGYNTGFQQGGMTASGYEQYNNNQQQFNTAQVRLLSRVHTLVRGVDKIRFESSAGQNPICKFFAENRGGLAPVLWIQIH